MQTLLAFVATGYFGYIFYRFFYFRYTFFARLGYMDRNKYLDLTREDIYYVIKFLEKRNLHILEELKGFYENLNKIKTVDTPKMLLTHYEMDLLIKRLKDEEGNYPIPTFLHLYPNIGRHWGIIVVLCVLLFIYFS